MWRVKEILWRMLILTGIIWHLLLCLKAGQQQRIPPAKRITMFSDSMIIRGAMTAYSWVTKSEAKAFAMNDSTAMCQWITQGMIAKPDKVRENLAACFKLLGKKLP